MTEQRRIAWKGAIRKSRRGEPVSPKEHYALLCEGLFRGLGKVDVEEGLYDRGWCTTDHAWLTDDAQEDGSPQGPPAPLPQSR